ncbi:DUF1016 N-terminal domain-containing protein [Edaphobacter aggregans]|uniref:DUF1016 N-terminal domain-containing protein n=1 Tax=Edaphobacter aggregans TaxID=570835 RepID=UPI0009FCE668|nr:DUF1016 N-terminal domain-containing protein [Edaphobacter aggregans]
MRPTASLGIVSPVRCLATLDLFTPERKLSKLPARNTDVGALINAGAGGVPQELFHMADRLAQFIARTEPGLRGFTRRNLFRMKQFYEAYREDSIVSPLVAQLPWSHHLLILGQSKRPEERVSRCTKNPDLFKGR